MAVQRYEISLEEKISICKRQCNVLFTIAGFHTVRAWVRVCIMGLSTQDPYIQKEHTKLYKLLKFRINWANNEQDTAAQNLKKLLKNVWIAGHLLFLENLYDFEWLYLVQYWPN